MMQMLPPCTSFVDQGTQKDPGETVAIILKRLVSQKERQMFINIFMILIYI